MRSFDHLGAVLLCSLGCVIAAGCSGGTGMQASPAITRTLASTQSSSGGNVSFAIAVKHATPSGRHAPNYVSPSTYSIKILTDGGNPVVVNLETGAANCESNGGTLICTAHFSVPAGPHVFTVTAYDQPNAGGNVLSTNTTGTVYIKAVGTTTISVELEGVVAYIALALATNNPPTGAAATIGLQVVARDFDGNIIVGPAAYDNPITLTTTDPVNGALTETKLSSPADSANLRYSGAKVASIIVGATAAGVPPANVTNAGLYPGTQNLYVANAASAGSSISVFDVAYPKSPVATIPINPLLSPQGLTVDSSGILYASVGGGLLLFDTQHFNAPVQLPPFGFGFVAEGLTIDANGRLYAAGQNAAASGQVGVYTTNPLAYDETITGPCLAGFTAPWGVAFGLNGRLYVSLIYTNSVDSVCVFDTQHGNAPLAGISGLTEAYGEVVDTTGKLYVTDYEGGPTRQGAVAVFDTVHGNAALAPIVGGGLNYPQGGLALDASGKLYVSNNTSVSVFDTAHGNAALPPIATGLSAVNGLAVH